MHELAVTKRLALVFGLLLLAATYVLLTSPVIESGDICGTALADYEVCDDAIGDRRVVSAVLGVLGTTVLIFGALPLPPVDSPRAQSSKTNQEWMDAGGTG